MSRSEKIIFVCLTLLVSLSLNLRGEEENSQEIDKSEVPSAVIKSFSENYPEMGITAIEMWESDGVSYYELECGSGNLDVIYIADGTLYATEEEIEVEELPQAVLDALEKNYPNGETEEAEKITRGSEIEYEVAVVVEGDDEDLLYEVIVAGDGKIAGEQAISNEDEEEPGIMDEDDE